MVAATTSFMLVFTSLSGATEFLLLGSLSWQVVIVVVVVVVVVVVPSGGGSSLNPDPNPNP